jgi:hypothetical protein
MYIYVYVRMYVCMYVYVPYMTSDTTCMFHVPGSNKYDGANIHGNSPKKFDHKTHFDRKKRWPHTQDSEPRRRQARAHDEGGTSGASTAARRSTEKSVVGTKLPVRRMEDDYGHTATFECGHAPDDHGDDDGDGADSDQEEEEELLDGDVVMRDRDGGGADKRGRTAPAAHAQKHDQGTSSEAARASKSAVNSLLVRSKAGASKQPQEARSQQNADKAVSGEGAGRRPAGDGSAADGAGFVELLCGEAAERWKESTDEAMIAQQLKAAAKVG